MKKKRIRTKFIYDDSKDVLKDLEKRLEKTKTQKDFLNFICYFDFLIRNYIVNFEEERKKTPNGILEVDFIFFKDVANAIKREKIGLDFPDYPTKLSKKISSLKFKKEEVEYFRLLFGEKIDFIHKIDAEYISYSIFSKKGPQNFLFGIENFIKDLQEKFNFTCSCNYKNKKLEDKYKNIVEIYWWNDGKEELVKKLEDKIKKTKKIDEFIDVINEFVFFLKNEFVRMKKITEKNSKENKFTIIDNDDSYFPTKLLEKVFDKIKKDLSNKEDLEYLKKFLDDLSRLCGDIAVYSFWWVLWNESEIETFESMINETEKEAKNLKNKITF